MLSSSSKGQFYVLTAVVVVGFFLLLSRYIGPYSFIDSSRSVTDDEIFFFNNVKDKAEETVSLSNSTTLLPNLQNFTAIAKSEAARKGYIFVIGYDINLGDVDFEMGLVTDKYLLNSTFSVPRN
jgi:hypothetical protein